MPGASHQEAEGATLRKVAFQGLPTWQFWSQVSEVSECGIWNAPPASYIEKRSNQENQIIQRNSSSGLKRISRSLKIKRWYPADFVFSAKKLASTGKRSNGSAWRDRASQSPNGSLKRGGIVNKLIALDFMRTQEDSNL